MRVDILLHVESYCMTTSFHSEGEVWADKTSLTLPLFIEVSVPRQESERSCVCVLGASILPLSMIYFSIGFLKCSDSVVFLKCSDSMVFFLNVPTLVFFF